MPTTITKTVKPSGGDYTSLSAWEAGEQGDLVTADQIRQAECYAMADTTPCTIDGSTTDDTRYMRVYTPSSERHDGTYRTDKYRIEVSDVPGLVLADHATRIEGLQVKMTMATDGVHHKAAIFPCYNFSLGANQFQRVSHCVVLVDTTGRADNTNIQGVGLDVGASAASPRPKVYVWNTVTYRIGTGGGYNDHTGVHGGAADVDLVAYNCTSVGFNYGFRVRAVAAGVLVKNNVARGSTIGFYVAAPATSFDTGSDYNRCDDANSIPGANSQNSVTVAFVDYAGNDYHLAGSDTVAKDAGTDLSADSLLAFSDDIDGQTRTGTWDIGADEYVATGASGPALQLISSLLRW